MSASPSDLDALYPFLAAPSTGSNRPDAVLEEVRRSTAEKAADIVALRDRLAHRYFDVDPVILWGVLTRELRPICDGAAALLATLDAARGEAP